MKRLNLLKIKFFFLGLWNAVSGIALEIFLVYFFIFAGFLVCAFWWRALK